MQATLENSVTSHPLSWGNWPELTHKGASNGCGLLSIHGWPVGTVWSGWKLLASCRLVKKHPDCDVQRALQVHQGETLHPFCKATVTPPQTPTSIVVRCKVIPGCIYRFPFILPCAKDKGPFCLLHGRCNMQEDSRGLVSQFRDIRVYTE